MTKLNKTIEKNNSIAKYVIEGMMNKENDKFIYRLAVILSNRNDLLDLLVTGVPVAVTILDEDLIINYFNEAKSIKSVSINKNFDISINLVKTIKSYFKTQEEADKADFWEGNSKYSEETPVCREFDYNTTEYLPEAIKDAVEIEYL